MWVVWMVGWVVGTRVPCNVAMLAVSRQLTTLRLVSPFYQRPNLRHGLGPMRVSPAKIAKRKPSASAGSMVDASERPKATRLWDKEATRVQLSTLAGSGLWFCQARRSSHSPLKAMMDNDSETGLGVSIALASTIVLWSEYTLKTTGRGLPEGPGGIIGGLEGISYLIVIGVVAW